MATTYTLISSVTVGSGGAANIDFQNIPQTYTDLCLSTSLRTDRVATQDGLTLEFNASSANFTRRELTGNGASASSGSASNGFAGNIDAASATASTFSNNQIYIPNYTGSTNKSYSADSVQENNATTAYAVLVAGLWSQTTAISRITLKSDNAANFVQYSTAYLYGISNA
jgi:hypothetical protein